ncbi:hypothetical protein ACSBR1_023032 [Camellia fascicularis]
MANMSSFKALAVFFIVALFSATASAQEAPAVVPGIDVGSAFALPISAAVMCSFVLLSLFTLFTWSGRTWGRHGCSFFPLLLPSSFLFLLLYPLVSVLHFF